MNSNKKTNKGIVTFALFIATFLSAVEGTIVSTAMPTIVGDLKGISIMNWVFSIYLLTTTLSTPVYGKLVDELGRKPVFITGLLVFLIGSMLSGLSTSMPQLIAWRAVQGIGAGAILPISNTIIADIYPPDKRAQVMGLNNSAWGIASVAAPLLGGLIVDNLSWKWVFFINVPIGLVSILLIWVNLREDKHYAHGKLDIWGIIWLSLTIGGILYGVEVLNKTHINVVAAISVFIAAIIGLILFIRQEKRAADPIILLDLFKKRTFVIQNFAVAMMSIFLIAFDVYVPSWTQGLLGLPATIAGFATTPSSILWIFGSFLAGIFLGKMTPRKILMLSMGLLVISGTVFVFLPVDTPFYAFLIIGVFLGTGFGITVTSSTIISQSIVAPENVGMATSFNTLVRTLSQSISISAFGIVINRSLIHGIHAHPEAHLNVNMFNKMINPHTVDQLPDKLIPLMHQIYHNGLQNVFTIAVGCMALAFVLNLLKQKNYHIDNK
ncbi:EmrB QacA subfamily drug resistance transporter [Ligilactobacillus acidipiscis DSM 15836]|uniref:Drug resistance transporter, EmrB/QacA family n=2 Tax=Ligilactobacillus acidipiscis TaxID=89059 RepID=A0A1K1KS36_9LACO|nr:MDR family MFS transporter [Ligilactobacillus acidipiscis]KRM26867.1 EmrB QacA subfamily drug resistance transporter [Ligilactobacillus acidipiscis DSM 15836]GAW62923.1 major facilitator superfamily transporter [Ligilactobacillus acidipiscis]GEN21367.1 MFS transporter [Ligilactobacillus acidipiscis]SFV41666.1 drug resistance transporter, EmrB/QacA family [Ligilactobacillus acidipiscis]